MRRKAEAEPSDAEVSALKLLSLPADTRQEEALASYMGEHAALFRREEAEAEASVEAGVLVRVDRARELLSSRPAALTPMGERALLVSSLLALSAAERTARLKSCGLRLNDRLRIESEIRSEIRSRCRQPQ